MNSASPGTFRISVSEKYITESPNIFAALKRCETSLSRIRAAARLYRSAVALHGCCMDAAWMLHGCCMDAAWMLHGCCMDAAWKVAVTFRQSVALYDAIQLMPIQLHLNSTNVVANIEAYSKCVCSNAGRI
jgi:hypothetical protein